MNTSKDTRLLKWLAIILAAMAGVMFLIPFFTRSRCEPFDFESYATFVGGTAGPLGSLAGFIFVYISYRESISQKTQQEIQFNIQSFDQMLSRLLEYHQSYSAKFLDQSFYGFMEGMNKKLNQLKETQNDSKKVKEIYKGFFHGHFTPLKKWIKSVTAMLVHIDNYNGLGITASREQMILDLMTKEEKRALFYFYFIGDPEFSEIEKKCLKSLLEKMKPSDLADESHKQWLKFK